MTLLLSTGYALEALLRGLRLPYVRKAAPEVIATATTQRWEPAEVTKAISKLIRADLIIVDDVGLLPVSPEQAEALSRVVDAAYEKRSIAISSTFTPPGSTSSCPKRSPPRPSSGACTTRTS